jgi:hypothetical protein
MGTLNLRHRGDGAHQLLELFPALLTLIFINWHQTHLTSPKDQNQQITILEQSGLPCPRTGGVGAAHARNS